MQERPDDDSKPVVRLCPLGGAVLATVWALAPGCEGRFCLDRSFKTEAEQHRARASVVPGVGRELLDTGVKDPALVAASQARPSTEATAEPSGEVELLEGAGEAAEPRGCLCAAAHC